MALLIGAWFGGSLAVEWLASKVLVDFAVDDTIMDCMELWKKSPEAAAKKFAYHPELLKKPYSLKQVCKNGRGYRSIGEHSMWRLSEKMRHALGVRNLEDDYPEPTYIVSPASSNPKDTVKRRSLSDSEQANSNHDEFPARLSNGQIVAMEDLSAPVKLSDGLDITNRTGISAGKVFALIRPNALGFYVRDDLGALTANTEQLEKWQKALSDCVKELQAEQDLLPSYPLQVADTVQELRNQNHTFGPVVLDVHTIDEAHPRHTLSPASKAMLGTSIIVAVLLALGLAVLLRKTKCCRKKKMSNSEEDANDFPPVGRANRSG